MDPITEMRIVETIGLTVTSIISSTKTGTFGTFASRCASATALSTIIIAVFIVSLIITKAITN